MGLAVLLWTQSGAAPLPLAGGHRFQSRWRFAFHDLVPPGPDLVPSLSNGLLGGPRPVSPLYVFPAGGVIRLQFLAGLRGPVLLDDGFSPAGRMPGLGGLGPLPFGNLIQPPFLESRFLGGVIRFGILHLPSLAGFGGTGGVDFPFFYPWGREIPSLSRL